MFNPILFLFFQVISHIFSFLRLADKKLASHVCWSWYEASIHPMFLNKEVICLKDLNDSEIEDVLKVYSRSLRAFFSIKICGLGITGSLVNASHWVNTLWPLLADKVFFLEFFDTVEFVEDILPAMLNKRLKVLKIHNLQFSPKGELHKVKRLEKLEEINLDNFETDNIDRNQLLGIIPKNIKKICLKSMWSAPFIIGDIVNVLSYCSSHLETLELIDIDVTPNLMRSISCVDMRLKKFCLILADSIHYDHKPEMLWPLFKAQWPLLGLTLRADCLTNKHLYDITRTFENLENLSVSSDVETSKVTEEGIDSLGSLKKLKTLYIGFGREYRAFGAFY